MLTRKNEELLTSESLVNELTKKNEPSKIPSNNPKISESSAKQIPTKKKSSSKVTAKNNFFNLMTKVVKTTVESAEKGEELSLTNIMKKVTDEKKPQNPTISLNFGSKCDNCLKILKSGDSQYYCCFCQIWLCQKCGDFDDSKSKKGSFRLVHPHNMVWINVNEGEGMKNIDVIKFGKNLMFNENIQTHNGLCDCCGETLNGGFRYICLSCVQKEGNGFIDVCEKCINCLKGNGEEHTISVVEIVEKLESKGHDLNSHVFFRICFAGDYYNY